MLFQLVQKEEVVYFSDKGFKDCFKISQHTTLWPLLMTKVITMELFGDNL